MFVTAQPVKAPIKLLDNSTCICTFLLSYVCRAAETTQLSSCTVYEGRTHAHNLAVFLHRSALVGRGAC